jgi:hypothetical protein
VDQQTLIGNGLMTQRINGFLFHGRYRMREARKTVSKLRRRWIRFILGVQWAAVKL